MKRALFVVSTAGHGHLVRCRALAVELTNRGWRCTLTNKPPLSAASVDLSILDGTEYGNEVYDALKDRVVARIVDVSNNLWADMIVAGGAGSKPEMFEKTIVHNEDGKKILAGPQYALLRPEFREVRDAVASKRGLRDLRLLTGLSSIGMAQWIAQASVVINYGGMRAIEAACLGVPQVIILRNEGENLNASGLKNAGAALVASLTAPEDMADALLDETRLLEDMSKAGMALVDGLGCKRVADVIEELV